jgi:hypothetical protein
VNTEEGNEKAEARKERRGQIKFRGKIERRTACSRLKGGKGRGRNTK